MEMDMRLIGSGILVAFALAGFAPGAAQAGEYGYSGYGGGYDQVGGYTTSSKCCYRKVTRKMVTFQKVRPYADYESGYGAPAYRDSYDEGYRYRSYRPRYYSEPYRRTRYYDEGYYRPRYSEPYRYSSYDGGYRHHHRSYDDGYYGRPYRSYRSYGEGYED
jgi:hypothetical protein